MSGVRLERLKNNLRGVKWVLIDEYSMLGCSLLSKIDSRLRQAGNKDLEFGGFNLILTGDLK